MHKLSRNTTTCKCKIIQSAKKLGYEIVSFTGCCVHSNDQIMTLAKMVLRPNVWKKLWGGSLTRIFTITITIAITSTSPPHHKVRRSTYVWRQKLEVVRSDKPLLQPLVARSSCRVKFLVKFSFHLFPYLSAIFCIFSFLSIFTTLISVPVHFQRVHSH